MDTKVSLENKFISVDSIRFRLGLSSLDGSIVDEFYERPEILKNCNNRYVIDFQREIGDAYSNNKEYLGFRVNYDFFHMACDFAINTHGGYGSLKEVQESFLANLL